jgi:hypothetical protein
MPDLGHAGGVHHLVAVEHGQARRLAVGDVDERHRKPVLRQAGLQAEVPHRAFERLLHRRVASGSQVGRLPHLRGLCRCQGAGQRQGGAGQPAAWRERGSASLHQVGTGSGRPF